MTDDFFFFYTVNRRRLFETTYFIHDFGNHRDKLAHVVAAVSSIVILFSEHCARKLIEYTLVQQSWRKYFEHVNKCVICVNRLKNMFDNKCFSSSCHTIDKYTGDWRDICVPQMRL